MPRLIADLPDDEPYQPRQISDPEIRAPVRQVDGQALWTARQDHRIVTIEIEKSAGQKAPLRRRLGGRRRILLDQFDRPDLPSHNFKAAPFADAIEQVDQKGKYMSWRMDFCC